MVGESSDSPRPQAKALGSDCGALWAHVTGPIPDGLSGKESACSAGDRRHRLDPCIRKIPSRRAWQPTQVFA